MHSYYFKFRSWSTSFISVTFTNNPGQKKETDKEIPDLLLITDLGFPLPCGYKNLMVKLKVKISLKKTTVPPM